MKRGLFLTLLFIIFFSSFVSSIEYTCPDPSNLKTDIEEIDEGQTDTLIGLPIGICRSTESSVQGWIEAEVFLDSAKVTVPNSTVAAEAELLTETVSIGYSGVPSGDQVTLVVSGSSQEVEVDECVTIGNYQLMLTSISGSGESASLGVLIGTDKITLNSQSNPSEIKTIDSKEYAIQIKTGSHTQSTIQVNKCEEGSLSVVSTPNPEPVNTPNQTSSLPNVTGETNTTPPTPSIINQTPEVNPTVIESSEEKGFFSKFWDWIKSLFS